jgi:type I restriction enzyme S subunit
MTLKLSTIYKKDIKSNIVKRMDSKFWLIKKELERFFETHKNETLDNLKEYYVNGLEFRDFNESFETPYIRVSDMKQPNINLQAIKYVNVKLNEIKEKFRINDKTVLLSRSGNVGIASLPDRYSKQAIISSHIIKIQLKDSVSPFYIVAIMNSKIGKMQIFSLTNGQLIKEINRSSLKEIKIPFLDNHNEIEEKMKKINEKHESSLNLIHQAQQLFYQKLGIDFSKIKKEQFYSVNLLDFRDADLWSPKYSYPLYVNTLKAIKEKWQTVKIDEIATVKKGNEVGSENYKSYLYKKDSDIPFIRTSDLVNYEVDLFPDFYIPKEIYEELNQDIKSGDVLFTKDGKIGMVALVTEFDKVVIASGLSRLRLKKEAKQDNLTPEYLFLVLSLRETGLNPALRQTVIASTIPHLREERLKEIEIPILDKNSIDEITKLVKEAFKLKGEKKKLIQEVRKEIDKHFEV